MAIKHRMFGNLTCMFSFYTGLQSGGKKGAQLLNTLFMHDKGIIYNFLKGFYILVLLE